MKDKWLFNPIRYEMITTPHHHPPERQIHLGRLPPPRHLYLSPRRPHEHTPHILPRTKVHSTSSCQRFRQHPKHRLHSSPRWTPANADLTVRPPNNVGRRPPSFPLSSLSRLHPTRWRNDRRNPKRQLQQVRMHQLQKILHWLITYQKQNQTCNQQQQQQQQNRHYLHEKQQTTYIT